MKIVLAAAGSRGDISPLLVLGSALLARGHETVFCAAPNFQNWVESQGLPFRPCGRDLQAMLADRADVLLARPLRLLREAMALIREEFTAYMDVLQPAAQGADLVVGTAAHLAAHSAAESAKTRFRCVVYCPLLFPSGEHPPAFVPFRRLPRTLNSPLWILSSFLMDAALKPTVNRRRRDMGLRPVSDLWRHCLGERPILAADPALAPLPADVADHVNQTGALLFNDPAPLDPELESFLSAGPPPVYIGFGSMTDKNPGETSRMLRQAVRASGVRALISAGWAGFQTDADPFVRTIGEVSHARLFPSLAAVVHHGGAGTTATAARAGVPQIIIPHLLDQHYWARRVRDLGLGPPSIPRKRLNEKSLAAALRRCVEDAAFSARAKEFAACMHKNAVAATVLLLEDGR
jgi:vancomycin aglycone glucosyltransferase